MSTQPFIPVTREMAAKTLSVSIATIDNWILRKILPKPVALGERLVYWHPDSFYGALDAMLKKESPDEKALQSAPGSAKSAAPKESTRTNEAVDRSAQRDARELARLNGK